jgi:hypothetical protein
MIQRFSEAVPTKRKRKKNVNNVLSQRRTPPIQTYHPRTDPEPIQEKFHGPKVPRSRSDKKERSKNV